MDLEGLGSRGSMTPEQLNAAKSKAVELVKALKVAESGKTLSHSNQAILDWAAGSDLQESFDSIGQTSGATGIPKTVLSWAKKEGCPAFRGSRVYLLEFLQWYFNRDRQQSDPDARLKLAKTVRAEELAEQEKINTAKLKEELMPKADAVRDCTRYASNLRGKLVAIPRSAALPVSLLREPAEIEAKLMEFINGALREIHAGEWGELKCRHCKKPV